jgi:NADPH2:quinone reductase
MSQFRAFRIHERDRRIEAGFESMSAEELTPGDVLIRVHYSSINYKDALAATGTGKILRRFPLNGGIDLSGVVASSGDARYQPGQAVLVTGCGLSETVDGGYAEYARVAGDSVIRLPDGIDLFQSMALGTAGFTAALAVHRMEHNGQSPAKARSS